MTLYIKFVQILSKVYELKYFRFCVTLIQSRNRVEKIKVEILNCHILLAFIDIFINMLQ